MKLEAGHIVSLMRHALPLPERVLLFDLYDYTQSSPENKQVIGDWCEESARVLIGWHYYKKTLIYHRDPWGAIDGLLMWYQCSDEWGWEDIQEWRSDDKEGDTFFLAFCWAAPGVLKDLCLELIRTEPRVITHKLVTIREGRRGPGMIRWDQRVLVKILQSKNHGKRK